VDFLKWLKNRGDQCGSPDRRSVLAGDALLLFCRENAFFCPGNRSQDLVEELAEEESET
jgi:hypothetical protein